jgi:2-keto-3-deoxy-L-rhamnonate aldolase RhmA
MTTIRTFRERLRQREPMMGTFLKTPSAIVCEVLGLSPLDCVCIDAEHAPFGRMELDGCLAALRAAGMPALVRVQSDSAGEILGALDSGATGLVLPHVVSGEQAAAIVRNSHYSTGGRGYAGSSRAANYTTKPMAQHLLDSGTTTTVIVQIEDAQALPHLDAIAATEGVDCLFVGRMDLTLSLGASNPADPIVVDAVEQICEAGRRHGKAVGMFVPGGEDCIDWQRKGATLFLLASDQQFLLDGARALMSKIAPRP